ncbi:hypothetical protein [Bdellovibrio sp. NC01]|uniref:hypothetical protein n=1 Tax=Bdellovibrio sp. NC01 TaxID=2220073 RepID=UPI0011593CD7|nr:hypothetical protein [Bdellovibrio sp. NC01]QDK36688.1 hypothetical protein DOE51_03265 [Bdellovibrio sp. NC01]
MKHIASILLIALFSVNTFAGGLGDWIKPGRPNPYEPNPGRPNITCSARDNGWEEHWGGHRDCRECVAKHGNCTETCSASYFTCQAEGVDYRGYKMTLEGRAPSRYETERQVMDLCQRQYRYQNCRIISCNENSETVSRRSCR